LIRGKEIINTTFFSKGFFLFAAILLSVSCSFDYSPGRESEKNKPDIIMEDIQYVRVRGGDPLVRFQAEYAERWEDRQIMEFRNFIFEQMEDQGETLNAEGRAGAAVVQTGSGDISLSDGVKIDIKTEDIIIRTAGLEWIDKEKHLLGGETDIVEIESSDGTSFIGIGFSANARDRTWAFSGRVEGRYVETEDEEDDTAGGEAGEKPVRIEWQRNESDYMLQQPEYYSHEEYAPDSAAAPAGVVPGITGSTTEQPKTIPLRVEEK